jgi:adenosylcobinamide-phosphate synthase
MTEYLEYFHTQLIDPNRLPVAVFAILLCAVTGMVTGPMHGNANPFYWLLTNGLVGELGKRLDRTQRKAGDLMMRGFLLTVVVLLLSWFVGQAAGRLALRFPMHGVTEIVLLALTLTAGTPLFALLRVYTALEKGKVGQGAYYNVARTTRVDLSRTDDFGITRTAMGMVARTYDKGLVAPLVWYLILGLPGAFIYAGLAAMAWRFGKDGFTKGFGAVPLALERLMGFIPMALAGCLMALAGLFTPTGGMTRAFTGLLRAGGTPYNEGGLPVTAMAHALKVSLGGPANDLDGSALKRQWVGPDGATAKLEAGHLRRALYIVLMADLLLVASLLGALVWGGLIFNG